MKIAVAQIHPSKGNILENIEIHKTWIEVAVAKNTDFVVFPEMSLTGYEPRLSKELAMDTDDARLDKLQQISNVNDIAFGVGAPVRSDIGIHISMLVFQPNQALQVYHKQKLHDDEMPFFMEGHEQLIIDIGNKTLAPAICYESLLTEHIKKAKALGADLYLASVAKPQRKMEKAYAHYSSIARDFGLPVLLSNAVGFCDDFESAGKSAIWDSRGTLLGKLSSDEEALLQLDSETGEIERSKP